MIKFFRNIRKSLIEKNDMGKYLKYAIGEILLVVIGILIALQINNWNQNRQDRISERKLLNNIHVDFLQNKIGFDAVKRTNLRNLAVFDSIIALFPIEKDTVKYNQLKKIRKGLKSLQYNAYSSSVTSLVNSNAIEIIRNEELKKYLFSWNDVLLDFKEEENYHYEILGKQFNPYLVNVFDFTEKNYAMNLEVASSIKYQNLFILLRNSTRGIIKAIKEEPIENHINEIIRLTKPESDD